MIRLLFAQSRSRRRLLAACFVAILFCAGVSFALAQGNTPGKIKVGDTVTGTLDSKNFAQAYALDGAAGAKITITATRKTAGLALAVILASPSGAIVSQAAELTQASVTLKDVQLPVDGQYLITVLRATGAQGGAKGDFTLAITGAPVPTAAAGTPITLQQGMSVNLTWNTADNLSLEVRDPIGGDINWHTPSSNGGTLDHNTNADCATATANSPNETVSWPAGNVPGGSYEIIVYFNKVCASPIATAAPVQDTPVAPPVQDTPVVPPVQAATQAATMAATASALGAAETLKIRPNSPPVLAQTSGASFALTININGDIQDPIRGTLQPDEEYVTSYVLNAPDKVTLRAGGVNSAIDLKPFANKVAAPIAFGVRTAVTGSIDRNNPVDVWSIDLAANRTINIEMDATPGVTSSLDPFLVLLAGDGSTILASNDDASDTTRNSLIANQTLKAGKYLIVATRFALAIGGTEGPYSLAISNGRPANVTPTTTPPGGVALATGVATKEASLPTGSIEVLLAWNSRADMRLLIRDPAGQSVFADNRQPAGSGILTTQGNFNCQNTTTAPVTYAYWPTSQIQPGTYEVSVWLQSRCQDTTVLPSYSLTITVNGKAVGAPITDRPDPNSAHTLTTFTTDASGNATRGPVGVFTQNFNADVPDIGGQLSSAVPLQVGTVATGNIAVDTPFILYTFQAKNKDHVIIDLKQTTGNLDPDMFLLDSNGKQLAENDDRDPRQDRNSRIDFHFTKDGTYIVVASRYGVKLGGTSGGFELDTVAK